MEDADERLLGTFEDGDDLAAATTDIAFPLLGDGHPHGIPVEGAPGLGGLDKDVFLLPFDPDEHESLAGHHGRSHEFGNDPYSFHPFLGLGDATPDVLSLTHSVCFNKQRYE